MRPDISAEQVRETVRCDACGCESTKTLLQSTDLFYETTDEQFQHVKCRRCGLIYLNPRPAPAIIHRYYPQSYTPFNRLGIAAKARNWLYRRNVRDLAAYVSWPNRVVDIGCGSGELLHAVRTAGNPNLSGVEPSEEAAARARTLYGLTVHTGTLDNVRFESESVDTVLMSHVLEHVGSPSTALDQVAQMLRPGGAVILWLPNAASFAARILGPYWMGWDIPRHLYVFTPKTAEDALQRAGFTVESISHEAHGLEWSWGLRLWARRRWPDSAINRILTVLHPFLSAKFSAAGIVTAIAHQSGRIRIVARKTVP